MSRVLALLSLAVVLASGICAGQEASGEYLVFFLNGKSFCAMGEFKVVGKSAHIMRNDGNLVSYPVNLLDLVETERNRQLDFGCARVIEVGDRTITRRSAPAPTPAMGKRPLVIPGADSEGSDGDFATPTPMPDIMLRDLPYSNQKVTKVFAELLDDRRIYLYKTSVGSRPEYLFIRATTEGQREVFATLTTVADAFVMVRDVMPEAAPAAVELVMIRTSGHEAGTFRITPEMATTLASGRVTIEEFYFRNVIF